MSPQPAFELPAAVEVLSGTASPADRLVVRADNGWPYEILELGAATLKLALAQAGASLLRLLGIFTADIHLLRVPPELIRHLRRHDGTSRGGLTAVAAALPVDPLCQPLSSTLPAEAAEAVINWDDLLGVAVADVWTGCRQGHRRWYCRRGPWWICTVAGEEILAPVLESSSHRSRAGDGWPEVDLAGFGATDVDQWVQRIEKLPEHALASVLEPLASAGHGAGSLSPIAASIQGWLLGRRRELRDEVMTILGPKLAPSRTEAAKQASSRPGSSKCRCS
ncbi:MAG: hypothetical protein ACP5VC_17925 [Bryobacteraceae bacterium]